MRYFSKLLTLILCICNVNCMETDQSSKLGSQSGTKSLNKTHIYNKKASNSLGIVYKNNNPKSSPILYSNITISQDNTNQSTITIENQCIEDQKTEHIQINLDSEVIQNIKTNNTNLLLNNITNSNILDNNNKQSIIKQSNEQINKINNEIKFNSFLNFSKYYNLRPQDISETSTCSSWFVSLKLYWENGNDKNNNLDSKYCSEYILSNNLLKTISCINKLVNLILCDTKNLLDNKYVINYINEYLVDFVSLRDPNPLTYNNTNLPDPSTDLSQKYQIPKYDKNILYTDAMTYIFYRTFKALQYLLYSLDQQQTNCNSITEVMQNKKEVNNGKQKLKEILKQSKEIINKKINECKEAESKLAEYRKYYKRNKLILKNITQKIEEYNSIKNNTKDKNTIEKLIKKIRQYENDLKQINEKLLYIDKAKSNYKQKIQNIATEIKKIKKDLDTKYEQYLNNQIICDYNCIIGKIKKNLYQYYDNKEQLDSNLVYIYNNNKNLNPTKLNIIKNNEKQIIDNVIKNNDNIDETN